MVLYDRGDNKVHHGRREKNRALWAHTISVKPRSESKLNPSRGEGVSMQIARWEKEEPHKKIPAKKSDRGRCDSAAEYSASSRAAHWMLRGPTKSERKHYLHLFSFFTSHLRSGLPVLSIQPCLTESLAVSSPFRAVIVLPAPANTSFLAANDDLSLPKGTQRFLSRPYIEDTVAELHMEAISPLASLQDV